MLGGGKYGAQVGFGKICWRCSVYEGADTASRKVTNNRTGIKKGIQCISTLVIECRRQGQFTKQFYYYDMQVVIMLSFGV